MATLALSVYWVEQSVWPVGLPTCLAALWVIKVQKISRFCRERPSIGDTWKLILCKGSKKKGLVNYTHQQSIDSICEIGRLSVVMNNDQISVFRCHEMEGHETPKQVPSVSLLYDKWPKQKSLFSNFRPRYYRP